MTKWILLFITITIALIMQFYPKNTHEEKTPSPISGHAQENLKTKEVSTGLTASAVKPSTSTSSGEWHNINSVNELKKIVINFPATNTFDFESKQNEQFESIAKNKNQTRQLLRLFGDLNQIKSLFGADQAKARVKLLDFFRYIKNDYSQEIAKSLIEIQRDPNFAQKHQGRDFDYRDLAKIYFSSLPEEYLKYNLVSELKKINYHPKDNWLVAYAIAHSHPQLLKDKEFTESARKILAEEVI